MTRQMTLEQVAAAMVAPGKGILAADESSGTIKKRFDSIKAESSADTRRDYREMLFRSSDAMKSCISGVILYEETIKQSAKDGTPLPKLIEATGALPGIKVDKGTKPLPFCPGETISVGGSRNDDGRHEQAVCCCVCAFCENDATSTSWRFPMTIKRVQEILGYYEGDCPGTKANLARILLAGQLAGTGRVVILPVDQGSEHGPVQSFAVNPPTYDPHYHYRLAIEAGLSAFAAPLGMLEAGSETFAGQVPTILKLNNANALYPKASPKDQAVTAGVRDALRLGCAAIGLTLYPGAPRSYDMMEEARELIREAKDYGLATVVWSYPRDGDLSKEGETAVDIVAYAAHIAALLGAHIIKVKLPTAHVEQKVLSATYGNGIAIEKLDERVRHVVQCAFAGKRIIVFSGGEKKDQQSVLGEARAIRTGGGYGSIIGRNSFQREYEEARAMLQGVIDVYK